MDEFLNNIYGDRDSTTASSSSSSQQHLVCPNSCPLPATNAADAVGVIPARDVVVSDEFWREAEMTLEDFLTKTAVGSVAAREDDVRLPPHLPLVSPRELFDVPSSIIAAGGGNGDGSGQFPGRFHLGAFGNGIRGIQVGGRAKRRLVAEETVLDKATQQKQRRMIKNRESAARSRERKQAYTVELELLVTQLEEENAWLQREEARQTRERFKQLMENLIPVEEKRRPRCAIRRVNSMEW